MNTYRVTITTKGGIRIVQRIQATNPNEAILKAQDRYTTGPDVLTVHAEADK